MLVPASKPAIVSKAVINGVFTPTAQELDEAAGIVAAFRQSKGGVVVWNGKLVEEPIVKRMLRLIETHATTRIA